MHPRVQAMLALRATGLLLVGLCVPNTAVGVAILIDAIDRSLWPFVTPNGVVMDALRAMFYRMNWRDTLWFLETYGASIAGIVAGLHLAAGGTFRLVGLIAKEVRRG